MSSTVGLNPAQEAALIHVGTTSDRLVGIHGVAGAGKSTLIGALKIAAGPDTTLIALAPTSSAAANLGVSAGIESRTVASLIASAGRGLDPDHVLVLDEAGQLGNRQAVRVLEISRLTGARLILLGDNRQTGAIEQGKAFWLIQRLGLPTAELTESVRQETRTMKAAVTQARLHNYAESLANLDAVTSGTSADQLAVAMVGQWMRLKPQSREKTNILVLENATRLIVNTKVRDALRAEGAIATQETRLTVLTPSGMSDHEKRLARFYSAGQVVTFSEDKAELGIAQRIEYRVLGTLRDSSGRQVVRLVDEHGRAISWIPRLGRASHVNVFKREERLLAQGDRIQWRLANRALDLRNADRGSIEELDGSIATIRWDRSGRIQKIDLSEHKTWDHGYAETVYSAQSKTYDRVYVLAPTNSPLVTGQNYYTAITRARFGVKLWTEDERRLVERLERRSGQKTSALEALGRLDRDGVQARVGRHTARFEWLRDQQRSQRELRHKPDARPEVRGWAGSLAGRALGVAEVLDRWLAGFLDRGASYEETQGRQLRSVHDQPERRPDGRDR